MFFGLVVFYGISVLVGYSMSNATHKYIYIYIYIYINKFVSRN